MAKYCVIGSNAFSGQDFVDLLLDDPYPTLTELFTDARDQVGSSSPGERAGTQEKGW